MAYEKKPKSEWKKPGPKPGMGSIGDKARARIDHYNPLPGNGHFNIKKDDITRDFYAKANEILDKQLGKKYQKAIKSNLDQYEIKTILEMVKLKMVLDNKESDLLPEEITKESLDAALKVMSATLDNKSEQKEPNERAKDNTPTEKD